MSPALSSAEAGADRLIATNALATIPMPGFVFGNRLITLWPLALADGGRGRIVAAL
jgi:hypothetical protein